MLRRIFQSRRLRRLLLVGFLVAGGTSALAVTAFLLAARTAQRDFQPIARPPPPELAATLASIPHYRRDEDATYLTFTEWYLVFNPQEYARFLAVDRPSRFPYFRGIAQIWRGYVQSYAIVRRHYRFNAGYHLMLAVIGTSSTVEFAIKGLYEKSVGRLSEWTAGGARTSEDDFAARVARDYGDFIPTQPWFEFPFGKKLGELWSSNAFFGPHLVRKCERKFFLSAEYGVKALYAGAIRWASHSVYGLADPEVYLAAHDVGEASLHRSGVRPVHTWGMHGWILAVPHYQGFTDVVPLLAADGVEFDDIAGNDEIMLTLVAPADWTFRLVAGRPLFAMPLLTGPELKRVAVQVPVTSLGPVLRDIAAQKLRLEHLFDY